MRRIAILSMGLTVCMTLGLVWFAHCVSLAASEIAAGAPRCLQVPKNDPYRKGNSYQPASSWLDTTPLGMRGDGALYHAVLMVDEGPRLALYNWSYRSMSFKPDVRGGEDATQWPILCRLGDDLTLGALGDGENYVFDRNGARWSVDNDYEPSAAYGPYLLSFRAVEPDFRPLSPAIEINQYGNAYWGILVGIGRDQVERSRQWLEELMASDIYRKEGYHVDSVRGREGLIETVVACMPNTEKNPRSCQNRFIRDGMTFSFRHKPLPSDQWIKMQAAVFERVRSFKSIR